MVFLDHVSLYSPVYFYAPDGQNAALSIDANYAATSTLDYANDPSMAVRKSILSMGIAGITVVEGGVSEPNPFEANVF
jgi:hypothetical protein